MMRNQNNRLFSYERSVLKNLRSQSPPEEFVQEQPMNQFSASFVLQPRSLYRELSVLIFRHRENYVTFDEFYQFIRKLYISEDPDQCLQMFRQLAGQQEVFQLDELSHFLAKDILKMDLSTLPLGELLLRIGLEVFYHLCDDNIELDLKETIQFIKQELNEDIDFLETIDLFGFVQDIYSGQLNAKVTLQGFFQKAAPQLKRALTSIVVKRIQQIIGIKRVQFHTRQKNQLIQQISKSTHTSPFQTQSNEVVKSDIQKLLMKNFNAKFEVEIEESQQGKEQGDNQNQIVQLLQQSKPKIRGWLQRLSLNKANKWQLLFLQIDQCSKVLRAIKPESIKKIHNIASTEFICLEQSVVVKGVHRKTNSLKQSQQLAECLNRPVHTEQCTSRVTDFSNVFLFHEAKSSKLSLVKSWDIREIEAIFNDIKNNLDESQNYSGIIELAFVNNEPIDKIKSKLKTIIFKEHLLVIKDSKIILYAALVKHSIELSKVRIDNQKDLPFIPSHPFPFQLIIEDSSIPQQTPHYIKVQQKPNEQEDQNSVVMWQIDEDENENSDKESQRGFLDQLYDKFKRSKSVKKREIKIIFSAESEPKRRQWIFSLNYYKTAHADLAELVKPSNRSSFQTPLMSQMSHTPKQSYLQSIVNTQPQVINITGNQNVYVGGNHTHVNVGIFNIDNEDDYYDVFKGEQQNPKQRYHQQQMQSFTKSKGYCHTDPNEAQLKEQRLVTLPSNNQQSSRQIFNTSTVEVWQKFLIAFFRYLVKQKGHSLDEAQEPSIQSIYNRQLKICKPK